MSLLLIAIGGLGLYGTSQSNEGMRTVYEDRTVPLKDLAQINYILNRNRVLVMDMLLQPDRDNVQKRSAELRENIQKNLAVWKTYTSTHLTPEEARLAETFSGLATPFSREGLLPVAEALAKGDEQAATTLYQQKVSALAPRVQESIDALMKLQTEVAQQEYDDAVSRYQSMRALSIGAIVVGVAIAVLFGWTLIRAMSASLREAVATADAVAGGDLTRRIQIHGKDEVAQLLTSLSAMQESLIQVVGTVRGGSEGVSTASAEIAQGNQDLSSRTENQASALEETAASMEELSSTVRQNADNAQQANQLAQSASQVAAQGGHVVTEVVDTMRGISGSSKKIADIITVIDGIAFQTNILALNAAVEAARAGEQGRGFAVVAGEVRNLAQRSAAAAKEIKDLITDSVARVDHGSTLVDRAGNTMKEVVSSIQRVTDIMGEISAASAEQSAGVSQIGEAITQMDQVTQQNAALVEEMAAAANSLRLQSQDLVQAVAVFKIQGGQAQSAPAPLAPTRAPAPAIKAPTRPAPVRKPAPLQAPKAAPTRPALAPAPATGQAKAGGDGDWTSF
jgi:methyl-accepting chemotaxis protein-1 (serine sensor receptor)